MAGNREIDCRVGQFPFRVVVLAGGRRMVEQGGIEALAGCEVADSDVDMKPCHGGLRVLFRRSRQRRGGWTWF